MPFNGSGTYAAPALPGSWNPSVTGQSATPADWNTLLTDISTALSTCITKDGQTTVTADIPMNGHKITGLGDPTTDTGALNRQSGLWVYDQQTVAAVGQVDFINVPATVNNLQLSLDFVTSTNITGFGIQFYNSVGVLDTAASYYAILVGANSSTSGVASNTVSGTYIMLASDVQQSVFIGVSGWVNIPNIQGVKETQVTAMTAYQSTSAGGPRIFQSISGGRTVSGPITGLRITPTSGTISGKATLYASV